MTDFDEIYSTNNKEIERQSKILGGSEKIEIPRDSLRRPWSPENEVPFSADKAEFMEKKVKEAVILLPWYATAEGVVKYLKLRKNAALGIFATSLIISFTLAAFVPSRYYSFVHFFIPSKIDSISTRLSSVMEKVEFASLPVDLKMPAILLARELLTDPAKKWVLEHMKTPTDPSHIDVDAGYALANETLVIHGFGKTPEMALEVTQLYQRFFEERVNNLRVSQLNKIDHWADLRLEKINQTLAEIKPKMASVSLFSTNQEKVVNIRQKLGDKVGELVLKKINLQRLFNQISQAKSSQDLNSIQVIDESGLQQELDVYHSLSQKISETSADDKTLSIYKQEKSNIEVRIREQLNEIAQNTTKEISQIDAEVTKYQTEMTKYGSEESTLKYASGQETDFNLRVASLESQKDDLLKLKNQIQLDMTVPATQYQIIQDALFDPGARLPKPIVVYGLALLAASLVSILCLVLIQIIRPLNMGKWHTSRSF